MKKFFTYILALALFSVWTVPAFAENVNSEERVIIDDLSLYESNEAIVSYSDGTVEKIEYSSKEQLKSGISALRENPTVNIVQPNYTYQNTAAVNDELFYKQWALYNDGSFVSRNESVIPIINTPFLAVSNDNLYTKAVSGIDINAEEAWKIYNGGRRAVIAIIDTGIDYSHEDLGNAMWINSEEIAGNGIDDDGNGYVDDMYGWNFYNNNNQVFISSNEDSHGTHCAGTILATKDNGVGIAGIASGANVKIMSLKALGGENGVGSTYSIIKAIEYAEDNGAVICNLSLGTTANDPSLYKAIAKSGMLFVIAAGNGDGYNMVGRNVDISPIYPGAYNLENIITVANIKSDGTLDSSSNYGITAVDIAAPGNYILSTTPGSYGYMTGTSMAAPMVSAVCAMVYSYYEDITLKDVKDIVLGSAKKMDTLNGLVSTGGMLNAGEALSYDVSGLEHGQWNIPEDAYAGENAPVFEFDTYIDNGMRILEVKVSDKDNDIQNLRYSQGSLVASDFGKGAYGVPFGVNSSGTIKFIIREEGVYTFYARDKAGNETATEVILEF